MGPAPWPKVQPAVLGRGAGAGAEHQVCTQGGRHPTGNLLCFLTPGEEGCHGRRGNPLSKKPPVPGARLCGRLCCQGIGLGGSPVGRACRALGELCCHFPMGLSRSALPSVSPSTHPGWRDVGGLFLISSSLPLLPPSPAAPQEHPVPEKHHPLEPDLSLHPAQCHVVCGPAHHEPRGPPEQRGASWRGSPRVRGRVWMGRPWWKAGRAQALRPNKTGTVPW